MPYYQGALDGLCGPYAIANALEHCGLSSVEDSFRCSCSALASRRWPKVLWEGTTFGDLQRMLRRCKDELDGMAAISISYPFMRTTPNTDAAFWQRFDAVFANHTRARCAIIGLTRPSYHWIVATHDGGRVIFTDCAAGKPNVRKNRESLHAGSRNGNPKKWIIDRKELVLFEMSA
jgi:hypothetical protein